MSPGVEGEHIWTTEWATGSSVRACDPILMSLIDGIESARYAPSLILGE